MRWLLEFGDTNRKQLARSSTAKARLPLLRRSDDHHREVRARRHTTASAHSPSGRDQDRHVMTATRDSPHRLPDRLCALLNGHAATRLFVLLSMAVSLQLPPFGVSRPPQTQDLMHHLRADRYVAPAVRASWRSVRGVQIPIAGRVAPPSPPTRGFVLCSFSDAGPRARGETFDGAGVRKA